MTSNQIVILVCGLYLLIMIGTGLYSSKRNKKVSDYLVAGRKLNWIMTAITAAAAQIGVGIVLSGATKGYSHGVWPGFYYSLGCGFGLILAGLLVAKKLKTEEGYVPLDFFASKFGDSKGIRVWAWISNVPSLLGIFIAQILACGGILSAFGVPFKLGVIITAIVIIIYCTIGGMWGVVLTDIIQTSVILIGIPILTIATLMEFTQSGENIGQIFATPFIPKGMFTDFIYLNLPFLLSISISYDVFARVQSAKDAESASKGCVCGGIIVLIIGLFCSTVGAAASKLYPGVEDGIFTIVTIGVLNPVLAGVVIAAILAAAMSSASCVILSLGSCFARDFYNKVLHPEIDNLDELPKAKVISQIAVLGGSIIGILFAFNMNNIIDAIIVFNYPYMGSMLVPLLGCILWNRATKKACNAAIFTGGSIGVVAFLLAIPGPFYGLVNTDLALFTAYFLSSVVFYFVSVKDKEINNIST